MNDLIIKTISLSLVFILVPIIFRLIAKKYPQKDQRKVFKQGDKVNMTILDFVGILFLIAVWIAPPLFLAFPLARLQSLVLYKVFFTDSIYVLGNNNTFMWFSLPLLAFFYPITSYVTKSAAKFTQKALSKITKRPGSDFFKILIGDKNVYNIDEKQFEKTINKIVLLVALPIATVFLILGMFQYTLIQNDKIIVNNIFISQSYSYNEIAKIYKISELVESTGKREELIPHYNIEFNDGTHFSTWYLYNRGTPELDQIVNFIVTKTGIKIDDGTIGIDVPY